MYNFVRCEKYIKLAPYNRNVAVIFFQLLALSNQSLLQVIITWWLFYEISLSLRQLNSFSYFNHSLHYINSQKTRKLYGRGNVPEKFPKTLLARKVFGSSEKRTLESTTVRTTVSFRQLKEDDRYTTQSGHSFL